MSVRTPYVFNRNEKTHILSPDPDSLAVVHVDTEEKIDSGIWVNIEGKPATVETSRKWVGLVIEPNYYNASQPIMKPSGNVEAYFWDMRVATKQFTDDVKEPIKVGDLLTLIDGKPAKLDSKHTVPLFQVVDRGTDYIEIVTL